MSGHLGPNNGGWTKEQDREFRKRRLERVRALALADVLAGIARDLDQEDWDAEQRNSDTRNMESINPDEYPVRATRAKKIHC